MLPDMNFSSRRRSHTSFASQGQFKGVCETALLTCHYNGDISIGHKYDSFLITDQKYSNMPTNFPNYLDVDYTEGNGETAQDYPTLNEKIEKAVSVVHAALAQYRTPALMWTGGKDSMLCLYFVMEVANEYDYKCPSVMFIDHYQHFNEVTDFVEYWAEQWDLDLITVRNEDFAEINAQPGDDIPISDLNEQNRYELRNRLNHTDDTFEFSPDSYEGNHLLKTVALNNALEKYDIDGIFSGVRWDEQEARADETFFSPRHEAEKYPPHDRVHPILQFDERSVWDTIWNHMVPDTVPAFPQEGYVPKSFNDIPNDLTPEDLPVSPKYFEGFRSLGTKLGSEKTENRPAWMQDLEETTERAGRAQDKENLMGRLRDLGYM